jgi:Tetratricopeptide repeat/TIR domain
MAAAEYDVFLSHAWKDGALPQQIADALTAAGLHVWFDAAEIDDFASITHAVTDGLAKSKSLLAYYSATYPLRRACQWELTAAFLAAQTEGDPRRRVLVINPESGADHIHPIELRDAKFRKPPNTAAEMQQLVDVIVKHVGQLSAPLADIHPLTAPTWYGMAPVGSTRFVGRLKEMWEVHSLLHAGDVAQITGAAAATGGIGQVQGLGGVGKSLLAEEYALHFGAAYPGGVFWLRAYGNDDTKLSAPTRLRSNSPSETPSGSSVRPEQQSNLSSGARTDSSLRSEPPSNLSTAGPTDSPRTSRAAARWGEPGAQAPGRSVNETEPQSGDTLGSEAAAETDSGPDNERASGQAGDRTEPPPTSRAAATFELAAGVSPRSSAVTTEPRSGDTLGPDAREALRADQIRAMAELLDLHPENLKPNEIAGALSRKIASENKPCLWIVDDIPNGLDGDALRRWFAPHALARTLITTRSREYGSLAKGIDLSVLTPDEAHQLLTSRRKPANKDEEAQARGPANDLGYHALALDVTASALVSYGGHEPYRQFREELSNQDDDALELSTELADALPNGHEKSIAQTMLRSIRGLGAEGQDFLRLASVLAVAPIPASLVAAVFKKADGLERGMAEQRQRKAFHDVTTASLAETAGENQNARSVHTLVSRAVRFQEKASPERTRALRVATVEALRAEIARVAKDPRIRGGESELDAVHARQLVARAANVNEANLLGWLARYDYERGAYASARTLRSRELEFHRDAQGEEHPDTLTARHNLADTLRAQGDLAGARQHEEQVLEASRRLLGEEHPDTLTARNNLAQTLQAQGDLAGARQHEEQVLEALRRLLGEEHPDTLTARLNLAATLYAQGDLAGARQQQEQVLAARRRLLGEEHPDTLTARLNLAGTLYAQGDLAGARQHEEQALEASRRLLGEEHPDTLTARNNLAGTLYAQGDLAGARQHEEQVLEARRRRLGEEHPDTLTARNNLALTMHDQGDLTGARKLEEEGLAIRRRVLGPEHPDTLTSMLSVAHTLQAQGDLAGARQHQEQVLEARRRLLGEEHPDTLTARNNLAHTLQAQGDLAGARQYEEQVLEASRRLLGEQHPDTSRAAWNLFRTLEDLDEREAARAVLKRNLLWLLDRDPVTLGADQRKIREWVAQVVGKSG